MRDQPSEYVNSVDSESGQSTCSQKTGNFLWGHAPDNTLCHTYFITQRTHKMTRFAFMVFQVLGLVWAILASKHYYYIPAYLTLWGFTLCTIYFSFILFVNQDDGAKKGWKTIYIIAEIAATLEFVICPFFWIFLFPGMLEKRDFTWYSLSLEFTLHLLCPIFIWVEVFLTSIEFKRSHMLFLLLTALIYLPTNYIYSTFVMEEPVYSVMNWKDWNTAIYIGVAAVIGVIGYICGALQHGWKKERPFRKPRMSQQNIVTRLI